MGSIHDPQTFPVAGKNVRGSQSYRSSQTAARSLRTYQGWEDTEVHRTATLLRKNLTKNVSSSCFISSGFGAQSVNVCLIPVLPSHQKTWRGVPQGAEGRQAVASQGHALCLDLGSKMYITKSQGPSGSNMMQLQKISQKLIVNVCVCVDCLR